MAGGWWSRFRSWLSPVFWFLLAIATFTLVFVLAIIAVIATLVPGLGPTLFPELVTAGTSLALTYFAAVTIREGRRNSRTELVTKKLERLYSPLYHEVEASEGHIYGPELPNWASGHSTSSGTYWENYVEPMMSANLHLASQELVELYWKLKRSDQSDALAKEFCDRVRTDHQTLTNELRRLGGGG